MTFDDGTVVEYRYRPDGLPVERELTCGTSAPVTCADSHQVYVYDGLRLLEVYDVVSGTPEPSARYYYADEGEVPFAGDFDVSGTGSLERHYLVVDRQGSITGVLDANNAWVERVSYDAYGRPLIEPADAMAPEVSLLIDAGTSLEVAFSEEVFPAVAPASGDLVGVLGLAGAIEVRDSAGALVSSSDVTYLDDFVHGNGRNTTVRVPLSSRLADGSYTLTVVAGFLTDDWGNDAEGSVSFSVSSGSVVFSGAAFGDTDVDAVETSAVGNVLFFQSHLWDADAGLLHMKARVLDPSTGHFLQRDPVAYRDALNLYAGYAWDPVNNRDPTGESAEQARALKVCLEAGMPEDFCYRMTYGSSGLAATDAATPSGRTASESLDDCIEGSAKLVAYSAIAAIGAEIGVAYGGSSLLLQGGIGGGTTAFGSRAFYDVTRGEMSSASEYARDTAAGAVLGVGGAVATRGGQFAWGAARTLGRSSSTVSASARGNPRAIFRGYGDLSARQQAVLDSLDSYGAETIVAKKAFGQNDLAALTAATGDEFAMFTTGGRRLVVRGSPKGVPIDIARAKDLAAKGWRWSAHTHPGAGQTVLRSSFGDRAVLSGMCQSRSAILNSQGRRGLFTPGGDSLEGFIPW